MLVMKFGGTSVKDAESMKNVIKIIQSAGQKNLLVVLSAAAGITNQLIELADKSPSNSKKTNNEIIDAIKIRHSEIVTNLIKNSNIRKKALDIIDFYIDDLRVLIEGIHLLRECTPRSMAQAMSYGELLSSAILDFGCKEFECESVFIDARKIMKTDEDSLEAKVEIKEIKKNIKKISGHFAKYKIVITQGFIASDKEGRTTTLGRGGSDYSASIFGSVFKADEIQIWTDVSGVLTTDPRLIKSAVTVPEMTFAEIRELSFYGAKVLHPDTIKPAIEDNIPVRILNTFKPNETGTLILSTLKSNKPEIRSVILKQNCIELVAAIPAKVNAQDYFSNFLSKINIDFKVLFSTCTESNFRVILDNTSNKDQLGKLLNLEYKPVYNDISFLCICGSMLDLETKSTSIISVIENLTKSQPKQIIFGASSVSILAVFSAEKGLPALKKIHNLLTS